MGGLAGSMERESVEVLAVMADVGRAAMGAEPAAPTARADLDQVAEAAVAAIQRSRAATAAYDVVGPVRFRLVKRVLLRLARPFTYRLLESERALADGLEALAATHADQIAYTSRVSDSIRALVVSADLAVADAVERLREASPDAEDATVTALRDRVAELERRVAELEGSARQGGDA